MWDYETHELVCDQVLKGKYMTVQGLYDPWFTVREVSIEAPGNNIKMLLRPYYSSFNVTFSEGNSC